MTFKSHIRFSLQKCMWTLYLSVDIYGAESGVVAVGNMRIAFNSICPGAQEKYSRIIQHLVNSHFYRLQITFLSREKNS